jgi:AcrR family transcriptional regulator
MATRTPFACPADARGLGSVPVDKEMKPPRRAEASPSDEPSDRRHDLLDAAYRLIAEKGLEGLRTRDIAARAGVNISTLHYYFGTKETLLEAVVQYVSEKFSGEARVRGPMAMPTLRQHFENSWLSFQKNPGLSIVLQELALRAQRDTTTRTAFRALFRHWNMLVEGILSEEVRAGTFRADLDARDAAPAVTSFIMGAMMQLGVNARAFDLKTVSRQLERLLERGP